MRVSNKIQQKPKKKVVFVKLITKAFSNIFQKAFCSRADYWVISKSSLSSSLPNSNLKWTIKRVNRQKREDFERVAVFGFFERKKKQWRKLSRDTVKRGQSHYFSESLDHSPQHNKLQLTLTTEARYVLKRSLQNYIHKFIRISCVLLIKELYFWNLIRNYRFIYVFM